MKLASKLGAALAGSTILLGVLSVPAQAVEWQNHGQDRARYRAVDNVIVIEDHEADGNCAYVKWHFEGQSDPWKYLYDVDCAGPDRGVRNITGMFPAGSKGIWTRVCENDGGCNDTSEFWAK